MRDVGEQPTGYISRALTKAEWCYSQLEKESLAIIFGIKIFHQCLYGKPLTILTDHQAFVGLFNENKHVLSIAAAWLQCWSVTLASYEYRIAYKAIRQDISMSTQIPYVDLWYQNNLVLQRSHKRLHYSQNILTRHQ